MKPSILLTGATGFLGKELLHAISYEKYKIIPICSSANTIKDHYPCDLSNPENIINLVYTLSPSIIINLAAKVDFSPSNISEFYALNILCPAIMADYCFKNEAFLLQASTIAVNGKNKTIYGVDTLLIPDTDYGKSKLLADNVITASACDSSILRFGGIFGNNGPEHLGINKMIKNAKKGKAPTIVGMGDVKRNYIYVKDAAQAIIKCIDEKLTGIHYLGGEEKNIKDMLIDICEVFIPKKLPKQIEGEPTADQIVENNSLFSITPFRTAIEQMI